MDQKIYLCCFPYAGGNSSVFDNLEKDLSEYIKAVKVEYPGHGTRFREKSCGSWEELLADTAKKLNEVIEGNKVVLLGYSMGSLVLYELIQRNLLKVTPKYAFILSHNPPLSKYIDAGWDCGNDDLVVDRMRRLGGFLNVDQRILESRYFQKMCMLPLKSDLSLLQAYERNLLKKSDVNATVIYSSKDPSIQNIWEWDLCFHQPDYHILGDDHFVLRDHSAEIADMINRRLLQECVSDAGYPFT